jgi:hypothetical protein
MEEQWKMRRTVAGLWKVLVVRRLKYVYVCNGHSVSFSGVLKFIGRKEEKQRIYGYRRPK